VSPIPTVQLTHLGIFVHDLDRMVDFYVQMFGMVVSDQGNFHGKELAFLTGSPDEHHQVVLVKGRTGEPTTKVLSQVSFRVASLGELRLLADRSTQLGGTELEARNHANSWSIYFRDPEYNFIEMYVVTPWQVRQPWRVALDLSMTDEQIVADTLRLIEQDGVGIDLPAWEASTADRLAAVRNGDPDPGVLPTASELENP
jgi:catechol 2,3-dioxygenase